MGLLMCNGLLGLLLWHQSGRRDIVLVPANLYRKVRMTRDGVDSAYLEAMAMMLVNDRLNVTPENVRGSHQNILAFVDSVFYAGFKKQLALDARAIRAGRVSSSFYVSRVRSDSKALRVTVCGRLKRWVGERFIGAVGKCYLMAFSSYPMHTSPICRLIGAHQINILCLSIQITPTYGGVKRCVHWIAFSRGGGYVLLLRSFRDVTPSSGGMM